MDEAMKRNRKVAVLFIDWEAQFNLTIEHAKHLFEMYAEWIEPYWIALPLRTTNECSQYEPEWTCWDPVKQDLWVRQPDLSSITNPDTFPFYTDGMTFEEFVPEFGKWYAKGKLTMCFVGIRADESLNRWRAIKAVKKRGIEADKRWTTWVGGTLFNAYPIYDWRVSDIWTYHGKYPDKPYNQLYERMYQAGVKLSKMRICEPYGGEQRQGLWLYHVIEPETWAKIVLRVAGANTGALYASEKGSVMGNVVVTKPQKLTWEQYALFLLDTMPPTTAEHYRNKIAVWLHWYDVRRIPIEQESPGDLGTKDKPSWRRVCKMLLKNDYWCKTLYFAPTKTESYERYKKVMLKRRQFWNLPF
jgi:predicted phosphoadenosine phosphosulfate sulfurtransferase